MVELFPDQLPLEIDRGGTIRVAGTRVSLDSVVGAYIQGASPESIVRQFPAVQLADVYMALGYYLHHRDQIDAYLRAREKRAEELRLLDEQRYDTADLRQRLKERLDSTADDDPAVGG